MLPATRPTSTYLITATVLAAPVLLLVLFVGLVCTVSLALGVERRKYALTWSAQVLRTVTSVYSNQQ